MTSRIPSMAASGEESKFISEKVLEYEQFLNETLKEDLRKVLEERDKVYTELSKYLQLKNIINGIKETQLTDNSLKTQVDLGCNFYVQAKVPDTSMIYVCVGFGFYVEFTHEEALQFIGKKEKILLERSEHLTKDASKIKANIKIVIEGLREIQHIEQETKKPHREVF